MITNSIIKYFSSESCAVACEKVINDLLKEPIGAFVQNFKRKENIINLTFYPKTDSADVDFFSHFIDGFESGYQAKETTISCV